MKKISQIKKSQLTQPDNNQLGLGIDGILNMVRNLKVKNNDCVDKDEMERIDKNKAAEVENKIKESFNYAMLSGSINKATTFVDFLDEVLAGLILSKQELLKEYKSGNLPEYQRNTILEKIISEENVLRYIRCKERRLN